MQDAEHKAEGSCKRVEFCMPLRPVKWLKEERMLR